MPELTRAAQELARIGEQIHGDLARMLRWRLVPVWVTVAAFLLLGAAGFVYVNDRIDRNSEGLRTAIRADCQWYADIAESRVPRSTSEIGRRLVLSAAHAYDLRCAAALGPLDDPDDPNDGVDPEVYRPAPPPTPTASPKPTATPGR